MRKIVIFLISTIAIIANHINWLGSYDKALALAKKEQKPLMVLLIKNDCKECKDIVKNSFTNREYIDKINQKFISVILNYDIGDYPNELIYSNIFPTLFIIDSKEEAFLIKPKYQKDIKSFLENKLF